MKTIALFGGTGRTGKLFLERVLSKGYSVNALVRSPEKISQTPSRFNVIKGDVLNAEDVEQTLRGADIVVSLFGQVKGSPENLQTRGTEHIVHGMTKWGIDRVISLSGGGLPFPEKDKPKLIDKAIRLIMKIAVPKVLNDAIEHHKVLENSKTKWMIVRAPRLTNDAPQGTYRVGWVGVNASTKIARADLADFLVTQLEDETYNFQMPFVSN